MFSANSRILIVDDFEMVRMMLRRTLKALGYTDVVEAVDGHQGLNEIEKAATDGRPFDLVFSDLNMPNLNGMDLLTAVRMDSRFSNLPFVMVTAESESQYVVQCLQLGATDYIVKPFSQATLQKKIEKVNSRLKKTA